MTRIYTKVSFAGVVAVALLALGIPSIVSPAWAKVKTCADGNAIACIQDTLDGMKAQQDEFLAQQVKIVFVSSSPTQREFRGGRWRGRHLSGPGR